MSNVIIIQTANTKSSVVHQGLPTNGGVSILCWPVTPAVRLLIVVEIKYTGLPVVKASKQRVGNKSLSIWASDNSWSL
jgi:hypothetical protein